MSTILQTLAIAIQHHQDGHLSLAEQTYRQILEIDPNQPDALHLLGVIAHSVGNHRAAVDFIGRAIQLRGDSPEFHYNLANAYSALGMIPQAMSTFQCVVELKPEFVEAQYNLGNLWKSQGQLDAAAACFHAALKYNSHFVDALFNLAVIANEQNRPDDAVIFYRRLLELRPKDFEAWGNLAMVFSQLEKFDEAIACYARTIELNPKSGFAYFRMAELLAKQGKLCDAIARFQDSIQLEPNFPEAYASLGSTLKLQGHVDEALRSYRRAVELRPTNPVFHNNLGILLREHGQQLEAIACFQRAVELKADFVDAYNSLGDTLREQGSPAEAILCYSRVLTLKPDDPEAFNKMGNALRDLTKLEEAIICYRRAVELNPDLAEVHNNLGNSLKEAGRLGEAVESYRRAIELNPDFAVALNNLGVAFYSLGKHQESIACYRRALEIQPDYSGAHSNLLMTLQYCDGITLASLAEAHADFDHRHAIPLRSTKIPSRNSSDCLRVGFISADFGRHPVGYFLVGVFEHLRSFPIETICYSQRILKDDFTQRFQVAATQWRDVVGMTDDQLAEQIRTDRIDILVDLAGHTARNRILVFARKPAPIQMTWIGYEGTTGLGAIDYLIADDYMVPVEFERHYREKVLRMPEVYVCYEPPDVAPSVGPLPMLKNGYVTFGSFNNTAKITSRVIDVWSEILCRSPDSRLVLKYRGMTETSVKQQYYDAFAARGVSNERVELLPQTPYTEYLATYQRIDLALDPFPFAGGATTCEALWMGVPVVTCPGETFASRHSLSHLANIGLMQMVANDLDDYVNLAISYVDKPVLLAEIRGGLRDRMDNSPLCNPSRFAAKLFDLFQNVAVRS